MKNLFTIFGTINRKDFWILQLGLLTSYILVGLISASVLDSVGDSTGVLLLAIGMGGLIGLISLTSSVKRVRDITGSGHHWWLWFVVGFIPYIGTLLQLIFLMLPTNHFSVQKMNNGSV